MKNLMVVLTVAFFILSSCSSGPSVTRIDSNTQTDLSGQWNDTDVRIVCRSLIDSCLNSQRVDQEIRDIAREKGIRTPTVMIGRFRNESSEHIDTEIITTSMRTAIINSGKLDFVAVGDTRDAIRAERLDQLEHASEETAASLGREIGADFMLTGTVKTIVERSGDQTIRTYYVTAELTNITTNRIIWSEENSEIKKMIVRPRNRL